MTDNSNPAADMLESAKADTSRPLIVFLTSEMYPFSKTGGLADVLGALPVALHLAGANVAVVTPFYGRLATAGHEIRLVQSNCPVGYPWPPITAEIYQTDYQGVPVYFVSRPEYFDRRQYYNTYQGDYFDNCERFNFFVRAALAWCSQLDSAPAVLHANDWQTALAPVYLHFLRQADPFWAEAKSVLSIHNLAFQGRFAFRLFEGSGLPPAAWNLDGVEFHGDFNLLKGGIAYADRIVTVSPSYSREILSPRHGQGLEGILAKRRAVVSGILNGADYDVWSPEDNRYLPCGFSWEHPEDKQTCKRALIREMYLADQLENRPILSFIGRLRGQKGIDLLIDILPQLMAKEVGVVVLGEGNLDHEARLLEMMERYPGRLSVQVGYAEDLAHRILAGSDIFLMPSRYEPCGLTQMYALRFGAPPVATAVGGLIDTIISHPSPYATGFTFAKPEAGLFLDAVNKALRLWHDGHAWRQLMVRAMRQSFTWERSAEQYAELYRNLGFKL